MKDKKLEEIGIVKACKNKKNNQLSFSIPGRFGSNGDLFKITKLKKK
jgi:hypothetical protein